MEISDLLFNVMHIIFVDRKLQNKLDKNIYIRNVETVETATLCCIAFDAIALHLIQRRMIHFGKEMANFNIINSCEENDRFQ